MVNTKLNSIIFVDSKNKYTFAGKLKNRRTFKGVKITQNKHSR